MTSEINIPGLFYFMIACYAWLFLVFAWRIYDDWWMDHRASIRKARHVEREWRRKRASDAN